MSHLRYITLEAVEGLRQDVEERLDWYYHPDVDFPWAPLPSSLRDARIEIEPLGDRLVLGGHSSDAENALLVHDTLRDLTPHQASDERFWVYLTHFECAAYVAHRWLSDRPDDAERALRLARNHFFARDARGLIRDCGVSRLWWLGRIATVTHPDDPLLFLEIVLHRQDVRSALIERPSVSLNPSALREIFGVMKGHWDMDGQKEEAPLFQRETFRAWMRGLNRRGGVVALDALPSKQIRTILNSEAEQAIQSNANGGQPSP